MKLNAQWIVGFTDGNGNFHVGISKKRSMVNGVQVLPEFTITQHIKSIHVLYGLKAFFKCGVVKRNRGKDSNIFCYRVRSQDNLLTTIIPFFLEHPLKTRKNQDFLKFRQILLWMEKEEHLSNEGLLKIKNLRSKMNV